MIPAIRPATERKKSLVWLASYPKSGSTWLRLFVHAYLTDKPVDINKVMGGEMSDTEDFLYQDVSPFPLNELKPQECFHLRSAVLFRMACEPGDKLVKTHCCNGIAHGSELIPHAFTAGAIYVVRDPRDVAISYADHTGKTVDEAIDMMDQKVLMAKKGNIYQYLATWSMHVESWTEDTPYTVLAMRYEDMLAEPRKVFRSVCHMLTGGVDEARLERAIDATRFDVLRSQEDENGFVERSDKQRRFFRNGKSAWRDVLTGRQIARIEMDHCKMMKKLGYDLVSLKKTA